MNHEFKFSSFQEFILTNGRDWKVAPNMRGVKRMKLKECFANATRVALSSDRFVYCEGFASGIIPVHHAWLIDEHGLVVDNTWRQPGAEYFGVAFKRKYLYQRLVGQRFYGLLDTPPDFPLLTEAGLRVSEYRHERHETK